MTPSALWRRTIAWLLALRVAVISEVTHTLARVVAEVKRHAAELTAPLLLKFSEGLKGQVLVHVYRAHCRKFLRDGVMFGGQTQEFFP